MSPISQTSQCEHCNKSSLSLLLLRPSPVAHHSDLQAPGSAHARADDPLVSPLVPAGLTESRPVLRLLRPGFVHVYVPSPPPGTKSWLVYQVTDNADLIPESDPSFNPAKPPDPCARKGHNASGRRLLTLPQAHKIDTLWIAYSANLWNDTLKARNAANPQAMQAVNLAGGSPRTFKPEAQALKRQVLECNVTRWRLPKVNLPLEPVFPFVSLASDEQVGSLAEALQKAAAGHPKTVGKELAVVLPDPVGYAAELNGLRLVRNEFLKQDLAKPEHAHPLVSLQMMDGLRQSVVDEQEARSLEVISPVMSRGAFQNIMRVKPNPRGWPEGTRWEPMTDRDEVVAHGPGMGRVVFPDHEERRRSWAAEAVERNWQRYRKYLDEGRIESWKQAFDQKMQAAHGEPIKRYEADWWKARQFAGYADYCALHFDERDTNDPARSHCPGATYAREVFLSMTPQPLMQGTVLDQYLAELDKPATDITAQMQRALAGNQGTVLAALYEYTQTMRPDKLHDLGSGLLLRAEDNTILGRHHLKFGWLLHAGYGVSTLAITQALSAAVSGSAWVAGALGASGGIGPKGRAFIDKLEALLMATQAMKLVGLSAIQSTIRQVPLHVQVSLPAAEARRLFQQRQAAGSDAPPVRAVNRMAGQGKGWITVTVMTTNLELAQVGYDPKAVVAAGAGSVNLGSTSALTRSAQSIALGADALATLMKRQMSVWNGAALAMRDLARAVKGGTLGLDGQIGLVALLLNGWSVVGTMSDSTKSISDAETFWGVADASAGTVGGLAQVMQASFSSVIAAQTGQQAVQQSLWVLGAGVVASGAGAFGGLATAAGQFVKMGRTQDSTVQTLFGFSGASFFGQFTVNGVQFAGAFSEFMIARGSQRAIWFVGARVAAGASARLVALTGIGLTGWGLVFLASGLVFEIGVVLLTPDALQKHVQNSFFGQGGEAGKKYKTLADEEAGIRALNEAPAKAASVEDASYSDPMTGFMVSP